MATAAADRDVDPDRVSFTRSLHAARRSVRAGLGNAATNLALALPAVLTEITHEFLPLRRLRAAARVVKRKMSNYGVKRAGHRNGRRPTRSPSEAINILACPL